MIVNEQKGKTEFTIVLVEANGENSAELSVAVEAERDTFSFARRNVEDAGLQASISRWEQEGEFTKGC